MVIDTSAILAVLQNEPEREFFSALLDKASSCHMSAGTYLETCMIVEKRFGYEGMRDLELFSSLVNLEVVQFDKSQADIAIMAYKKYGKGNHLAGLNYGDCFSYALSKFLNDTLLYKGDDFSKTDVVFPSEMP